METYYRYSITVIIAITVPIAYFVLARWPLAEADVAATACCAKRHKLPENGAQGTVALQRHLFSTQMQRRLRRPRMSSAKPRPHGQTRFDKNCCDVGHFSRQDMLCRFRVSGTQRGTGAIVLKPLRDFPISEPQLHRCLGIPRRKLRKAEE